ncbi:hypothetical protein F4777DRAFT_530532 [Nemania sp. FL0916]|nr:hypothetical protein F4777DRAFT_530532 [Nemania sp. FL0916]
MDPLSIIASIAGVSTAGVSLSRAIYNAISTMRNAPRELCNIARGLSDLSTVLRELRKVLKEGEHVYRRKLIRRVASATRRVGRVQRDVTELLDDMGGLAQLKWIFRKSKTMDLLYEIESHKTGINLILQTMILAIQLKQISRQNEKTATAKGSDKTQESSSDVLFARHQAENVVHNSFHSIRELASEQALHSSPLCSDDERDNDDLNNSDSQDQQIQIRSPRSFDSAMWLYDLVFSPTNEALHESWEEPEESTADSSTSQALVRRSHFSTPQLQVLTHQPPEASMVINELLSEWTTLTEGEIGGPDTAKQQEKTASPSPTLGAADDSVEPIRFKDCVGRKFSLPFHIVREWGGMEELIKQMFTHVVVIGPHVMEGHYDLLDAEGNIILPEAWERCVKPGQIYTMQMWPMEKSPLKSPQAPSNPPNLSKPPGSPQPKPIRSKRASRRSRHTVPPGGFTGWLAGNP